MAIRRAVLALAGPALIVVSVLIVLHSMVFGGLVTFTQPDVPSLWLPNFCYLGRSLAHGSIPLWNPSVMGGLPFAADPQSGWMYLLPSLLFSALPCGTALRWYLVLNPILAGLGVYWFLRAERVSRAAATAGGLVLAMGIAGARLVVDLPFPATVAWTALLLAAGARCLRADTWPARLTWVALTALCWGQLAATHLSHGLVIGTLIFVCYMAARTLADVRSGRRALRERGWLLLLLVAALPLVNMAYFLPRFFYLPTTTLGAGYARIQSVGAHYAGHNIGPRLPGPASPPSWILTFAFSPGGYLGAAAMALAFAGWWSRRLRPLVTAFTVALTICYTASLDVVAGPLEGLVRRLPFGDVYLQSPWRFRYGALLALAVLAGLGVEAWREGATPRDRIRMLVPGLVVWGILPWFFGPAAQLTFLVAGAVVGLAVLTLVAHRPAVAALIPVVLAVELVVSGLLGQAPDAVARSTGVSRLDTRQPPFNAVGPLTVDVAAYVRGAPFAATIRGGSLARFLSLNPVDSYLAYTTKGDWPYLTGQRAVLLGVEDAQGYNSIEPLRYWTYMRAVSRAPYPYNHSVVFDPSPSALDLLQVGWEIAPRGAIPSPGFTAVARDGGWVLYARAPSPRASVVDAWTVTSEAGALKAVTDPNFQSAAGAILEDDPGIPAAATMAGSPGSASFRWLGPQSARIDVTAFGNGIVLVRNTFDPGWRATVDGHPATVLRANYFQQGVPVTAGTHTILLTYRDPAIGAGLAVSAVALTLLLGAAAAPAVRRRRRSPAAADS